MKEKLIVIASNNEGKIKEIKEIFNEYEVLSIKELEKRLNKKIILNETKETFKENSLEKVRNLYDQTNGKYLCIADDSGLEIEALNGFPGVKTARWIDESDHEKNKRILKKMENIKNRNCKCTTVIALKREDFEETFEESLNGKISYTPKGENGFGFDEIFELENNKTLAELSFTEKLEIIPRKKALEKIKKFILE